MNRNSNSEPSRRALVAGVATASIGLMAAASAASAAGEEHAAHEHHMHVASDPVRHQAVIDSAIACINRGEVCIDHCMKLLGTGDTSLKDCIRTVSAMLAMCSSLVRLAALDAKRLKEVAKVCADVCADCEAECKKHQDHHPICKACALSCGDCIRECNKLIDA